MLATLRQRNFALLWLGGLISTIVQKHLTRLLICLFSLYPLHLDVFSGRE